MYGVNYVHLPCSVMLDSSMMNLVRMIIHVNIINNSICH